MSGDRRRLYIRSVSSCLHAKVKSGSSDARRGDQDPSVSQYILELGYLGIDFWVNGFVGWAREVGRDQDSNWADRTAS